MTQAAQAPVASQPAGVVDVVLRTRHVMPTREERDGRKQSYYQREGLRLWHQPVAAKVSPDALRRLQEDPHLIIELTRPEDAKRYAVAEKVPEDRELIEHLRAENARLTSLVATLQAKLDGDDDADDRRPAATPAGVMQKRR